MVYISHNHTDHTGELPILLGLLPGKPRILGNQAVLDIVQQHRLHEVVNKHIKDIAEWIPADRSGNIDIGDGLSLHLFRSIHSYLCYGFILQREGQPILGYPADTAFDENIYDRVAQASFVILDGRDQGNHDHASLKDIDSFAQRVPQCSIRVVHYEETDYVFAAPNVLLWREGDILSLDT
jgi:ribonuclease BN (tRNA processing enzyme)